MRIPDGTATVCVEAPTFDESRSLAKAEKAVWELTIRKSGELLKCVRTHGSASTDSVIFVAEKRLQQLIDELLQLFCCDRLRVDSPFHTDCAGGHGPQTN